MFKGFSLILVIVFLILWLSSIKGIAFIILSISLLFLSYCFLLVLKKQQANKD
jgi:hypothetical protein